MSYKQLMLDKFNQMYATLKQDDEYVYFYKHLSFNSERVADILKNNWLVYSSPNGFNDPYDSLCKIIIDFSDITIEEARNTLNQNISQYKFKNKREIVIRDIKNTKTYKKMSGSRQNDFYVLCLNNSPLNILMWSHYAHNHTGIMLEFKLLKQSLYDKDCDRMPIPVFYNNVYPVLKIPYNSTLTSVKKDLEFSAEMITKILLNKSEVWSYENEFRQIADERQLRLAKDQEIKLTDEQKIKIIKFIEFEPNTLASITLGSKATLETSDFIQKEIKKYNKKHSLLVDLYQAKLSETEYKLEVKGHPRLDKG